MRTKIYKKVYRKNNEENPFYKPIFVGSGEYFRKVKLRSGDAFTVIHLGIQIITDNKKLAKNIQISKKREPKTSTYKKPIRLFYITSNNSIIRKDDGTTLRAMSLGFPGEIYVDSKLQSFAFKGKVKYGTLISIVYGLRAFISIDEGILGLHSAAIFDRQTHKVHLLIGKNKIGKSTIAQLIEKTDKRFVVISDDWCELNVNDYWVRPVSPLFSPGHSDKTFSRQFMSYGKNFYTKKGIGTGIKGGKLGKIIEIVASKNEMLDANFFQRAMFHIPFVAQEVGKVGFARGVKKEKIIKVIYTKIKKMRQLYADVIRNNEASRIINYKGKIPVDKTAEKVHLLITS